MHLRRALLLFAIVLGVAALVASLSPPLEDRRDDTTTAQPTERTPPSATATPARERSSAVEFDASENDSKRVRAGESVTVRVAVDEPGSVTIPGMGLTAPANPGTPARFPILPSPGRYEIVFSPAGDSDVQDAGRLVVTSAG